jgi:S1-C subfamily serine protease
MRTFHQPQVSRHSAVLPYLSAVLFSAMVVGVLLGASPAAGWAQRAYAAPLSTVLDIEEIANRGLPSTVTIVALDGRGTPIGFGSGVAIRNGQTVVTNWHVLRGASRAVVVTEDGSRFAKVGYLEGDARLDIALLAVPGASLTPATMSVEIPQPGGRVVVIGAPFGLTHTVSDGIVSATRTYDSHLLVQITAPISSGSSGGPVFDKFGRVFAIATSGIEDGQTLNFATPLRYALALLPLATVPRPIHSVFGPRSAK